MTLAEELKRLVVAMEAKVYHSPSMMASAMVDELNTLRLLAEKAEVKRYKYVLTGEIVTGVMGARDFGSSTWVIFPGGGVTRIWEGHLQPLEETQGG